MKIIRNLIAAVALVGMAASFAFAGADQAANKRCCPKAGCCESSKCCDTKDCCNSASGCQSETCTDCGKGKSSAQNRPVTGSCCAK
jgi:hypothetical protein